MNLKCYLEKDLLIYLAFRHSYDSLLSEVGWSCSIPVFLRALCIPFISFMTSKNDFVLPLRCIAYSGTGNCTLPRFIAMALASKQLNIFLPSLILWNPHSWTCVSLTAIIYGFPLESYTWRIMAGRIQTVCLLATFLLLLSPLVANSDG